MQDDRRRASEHNTPSGYQVKLSPAEQRFLALHKDIPRTVAVTDPAGHFVQEQEAWSVLTGQTWPEYSGLGWMKAIHPDDLEGPLSTWGRAKQPPDVLRCQFRLRRRDGKDARVFLTLSPIFNDDGTVMEWLMVLGDEPRRESAEFQANALRELNDLKAAIDEHAIVAVTDAQGEDHLRQRQVLRDFQISRGKS